MQGCSAGRLFLSFLCLFLPSPGLLFPPGHWELKGTAHAWQLGPGCEGAGRPGLVPLRSCGCRAQSTTSSLTRRLPGCLESTDPSIEAQNRRKSSSARGLTRLFWRKEKRNSKLESARPSSRSFPSVFLMATMRRLTVPADLPGYPVRWPFAAFFYFENIQSTPFLRAVSSPCFMFPPTGLPARFSLMCVGARLPHYSEPTGKGTPKWPFIG